MSSDCAASVFARQQTKVAFREFVNHLGKYMTDTVADMLTRIRNAARAGHDVVEVPFSALRENIAHTLVRGGFLSNVEKQGKRVKRTLDLTITYFTDENGKRVPKVRDMQRISKPSRRVYQTCYDIRIARGGVESYVLSTPAGIMYDREAKKAGVGGEVLFKILG